jgi:hypothetical protein
MFNSKRKVLRRPWIGRAHCICMYCGYRSWLFVAWSPVTNPWLQKPPWIRLGACCRDATLQVTRGPRERALLAHYDAAPTDELSVSQLQRRLRSRALPGAPRDPRRSDPSRLAIYHESRQREKHQRLREIIEVVSVLPVRIHRTSLPHPT